MSPFERLHRSLASAVAALVLVVAPSSAQLCFGGRPLPTCGTFVVFDGGYAHQLGGAFGESHDLLTGEVGLMRNRGHMAYGVTFNAEDDFGTGTSPAYGVRAHVRSWSDSSSVATDFSLGPMVFRYAHDSVASYSNAYYFGHLESGPRVGLSARAAVTFHDQFGVFVEGELRPRVVGQPVRLYAGANLGSVPALFGSAVLGLIVATAPIWLRLD